MSRSGRRPGRRGTTTFAVGVGAGMLAAAALSGGVLTGGATHLVGAFDDLLRVPSAAADELPAFHDCAQLRQWYVDAALPAVGPWGLGRPRVHPMGTLTPGSATGEGAVSAPRSADTGKATGSEDAVGSSATGTNVQEAGVDEADVAKTDGRRVVRLSEDTLVVTDVSGAQPRELSRTRLPGLPLTQPELLLHDDHVVVVGEESPRYGGPLVEERESWLDTPSTVVPGPAQDARTRVVGFDLRDPAAPRMTSDRSIDGGALSTREYPDGTVRVVVKTGFPPLDFVQPNRDRSTAQATRTNRDVVRAAPLSAWLPATRPGPDGKRPLLDCSDVRHPVRPSGFGTISVVAFPVDAPAAVDTTAVTASGDLVYSSATRLYVATTTGLTTQVHAFALHGRDTSYVASGSFRGTVKDRWSFDEHDGHLRVAAQEWSRRAPVEAPSPGDPGPIVEPGPAVAPEQPDNAVLVFDERDGRLEQTGRVGGLGRGEQIRSVRWFGDLAVVVTFLQTDPLYTVDLADPEHPRLAGTLRLPGFSSYLHPVGGHRLVGIGRDATGSGTDLGAQVWTFDLRDLSDVRRTATLSLGESTDLAAGTDPRAFTYLPRRQTLVTPVQDWDTGDSRFVALHVGRAGSLTQVGSWSDQLPGTGARALPLNGDRVALVGAQVRVVDLS